MIFYISQSLFRRSLTCDDPHVHPISIENIDKKKIYPKHLKCNVQTMIVVCVLVMHPMNGIKKETFTYRSISKFSDRNLANRGIILDFNPAS